MSIKNILDRTSVLGLARKNSKDYELKKVPIQETDEALKQGWTLHKKSRKASTFKKSRKRSEVLEMRVWSLFYRMGCLWMSGKGGAQLQVNHDDENSPEDQIDIVAVDEDMALAIECKSAESPKKDPSLPDWLSRFGDMRKRFIDSLKLALPSENKRHFAMIVFTWDIILTDNDKLRAEQQNIILFEESDLAYYEELVKHINVASRYQLLSEIFQGKSIAGLEVRVPALKTKMGKTTCYTFSIKPEYLLKISYVAHRAKGKATDIGMYQRMVSKARLRKISEFISSGGQGSTAGTFPTNIVINIRDKRFAQFERGAQSGTEDAAIFGWLTLRPAYGCAWIIDGQHRMFAYSGNDRAKTSYLNVLAYEALSSSEQAQLFVDINSTQRKVKRALLVELDADLKWNDDDENDRIQAIISKMILALDTKLDSPLRNCILLSDIKRTDIRCISLTSVSSALNRPHFFVVARRKDITEYGPLWRSNSEQSLDRAIRLVTSWFRTISEINKDWWAIGAGPGGGLAMNNGITVCLNILHDVFVHLGCADLILLDDSDLAQRLQPYAKCLGNYLAQLSVNERQQFRQLQGSAGQNTGTRMCQQALVQQFPKFTPEGLADWVEKRKKNCNDEARVLIDEIEASLHKHVLAILKGQFDTDNEEWWMKGVPKSIRIKVDEQRNEAGGTTGPRENNFMFIHYKDIITHNWDQLFKDVFGYTQGGSSKDKQTSWIREISEFRNAIAHHATRQVYLDPNDLSKIQNYHSWLKGKVNILETGIDSGGAEDSDGKESDA